MAYKAKKTRAREFTFNPFASGDRKFALAELKSEQREKAREKKEEAKFRKEFRGDMRF